MDSTNNNRLKITENPLKNSTVSNGIPDETLYDYCSEGLYNSHCRLVITDVSNFLTKYRNRSDEFNMQKFKILHIRNDNNKNFTMNELVELVTYFANNNCVWFQGSYSDDGYLESFANCKILRLLTFRTNITNKGLSYLKNVEDLELCYANNIDLKGLKHLTKLKRLIVSECDNIDAITLSNISTLEYLHYDPPKKEKDDEDHTQMLFDIDEKEKKLYDAKFIFTIGHYKKMNNLKKLFCVDDLLDDDLKKVLQKKNIYGEIPESKYRNIGDKK